MKWLPYPMLRIAAFFTAGVLLGIYFPDLFSVRLLACVITLSVFIFVVLRFVNKTGNSFYFGIIGLLIVFLFGYARLLLSTDARKQNHLSKIDKPIEAYEAIVRSVPEEKAKSWKVEVELTKVKTDHWQAVTGNILLYISKTYKIDWHYGDKILVHGSPQELSPPANPGEFDFKRFLSFKNISHQQFVQSGDVQFVSSTSYKGFIYYSHQARAWSIEKLNQFISGDDERAIASALVLGVTDGIDNDLQNAYAASGAMHVLAVSGMHVGIIYAIILFLFKPLEQKRWSKWTVAIVSFILLWSFAFITGNSPSVLRAVTMFSFIAIARPLGWKTNIYNTLAASVFVLLIYNPYLVMSVGFQLSYLAVLGIVYLQRPIYSLLEIKNVAGDWVWKITCVSIAAQIATFALGLLYFHQFPTYFLVSNLFVIPISTFVLVVGILLLVISFILPFASFVGWILEWLIKALNWIVFTTEDLPLSLINNIHITTFQCWLLMGIIVAFILLFEFKSVKWLYASFIFVLAFTLVQWNHFLNHVKQNQVVVYSVSKHSAIDFIDHGKVYFVCDSALTNDTERIRFHIQPNRLFHGVTEVQHTIPFKRNANEIDFYRWKGKTIAHLKSKTKLPENLKCDYLIVSNNSLGKKEIKIIRSTKIIFDGSNSKRTTDRLCELAKENNISTFSALDQGAFILQ